MTRMTPSEAFVESLAAEGVTAATNQSQRIHGT